MDIRKKLRQALFEGKHKSTHKNEYGCVMVYLDINKDKWAELLELIDEDDLYQPKNDPSYGKEKNPHVTILYGLHADVEDKDIEDKANQMKKPEIKFKNVSSFDGKEFDVLKFDVDSKDLKSYNEMFKKFPHTNNFPEYHPHATIAYLKSGKAKDYIDKLNSFINMSLDSKEFVYSKINGENKKYVFKK